MDEAVELENLPFMGIYEILQETYKLILQWRKIFTQITLAFILPLYLLFFTNVEISNSFLQKMNLQHNQTSTPQFLKLSDLVSSRRTTYHVLSKIASLIFSSIFYLLIIFAVVYNVAACIYTARDVSNFKHVIRVLPKVWKQLLVIALCVCAALFSFSFVTYPVLTFIAVIEILINGPNDQNFGISINGNILFFFIVFYFMAILYLTIIKQLWRMVTKLSVWLNLPLGEVQFEFYYFVVRSVLFGIVGRGVSSITWVLLFSLVKLMAETVVYFVCKWYRNCESVHQLALSDHLYSHLSAHYVRSKVDDNVHHS